MSRIEEIKMDMRVEFVKKQQIENEKDRVQFEENLTHRAEYALEKEEYAKVRSVTYSDVFGESLLSKDIKNIGSLRVEPSIYIESLPWVNFTAPRLKGIKMEKILCSIYGVLTTKDVNTKGFDTALWDVGLDILKAKESGLTFQNMCEKAGLSDNKAEHFRVVSILLEGIETSKEYATLLEYAGK